MNHNFDEYFKRYEKLVASVDAAFQRVQSQYAHEVACRIGCADCCHALFDVTLVEAMYINQHFNDSFSEDRRETLLEKCNRADRQIYKIKKRVYRRFEEGQPEDELLAEIAAERVACPFLNAENQCDIYEYRPITCRLYGIPTAIGGKGHTCGRSAFEAGQSYPTVNMDTLHEKLYAISRDLVAPLNSRYTRLPEILVPLSMAILTVYDDDYFGLNRPEGQDRRTKE